MADDLIKQAIEEQAAEPSRARDGAVEVQQRPIGELIAADKYLRKTLAGSNPLGFIKRARIRLGRPGGLP